MPWDGYVYRRAVRITTHVLKGYMAATPREKWDSICSGLFTGHVSLLIRFFFGSCANDFDPSVTGPM